MSLPARLGLLLVVLAALLGPATGAHAHTDLVASRPADGQRLAQAPTHVVLEFAQPVAVDDAPVQVTDPGGTSRAQAVLLSHTARAVSVVLEPTDGAAGSWTVAYRVRGSDGHVLTGRLAFAVGAEATRAQAPLTAGRATVVALSALAVAVLVLRTWTRRSEDAE